MRLALGVLAFYKRLFVPTLVLSFAIGVIFGAGKPIGGSVVLIGALFHYITYELRYAHDYFFYHNLGLAKGTLWCATIGINLSFELLFMAL
jgi:hypothetical protein